MRNSTDQVAVFIDFENIELSYRDKTNNEDEIDWSRILDAAVDFGRVVVRRAYGDWSKFGRNQRELLGLGIDLIHVSSKRGKNAADISIVIDALEIVNNENSNISHVILISGDGDFTELAHRLRARGKTVVGFGVSGSSAEYLIQACDQFLFCDLFMSDESDAAKEADDDTQVVSFDVSEARLLLRRVLKIYVGEWVSGGKVKTKMLQLNPAFNEMNYGFETFKDFLAAQDDMLIIRTAQPGGHLEVQILPETETAPTPSGPNALLDSYLVHLARQKIRMTPNEHRPGIILTFYKIYKASEGDSLLELKEKLHEYYEENAPNVKWQYVSEVVHQLFHTYCFDFDQDDSNYPPDVTLWGRRVSLTSDIASATDLLVKCDQQIIKKIARELGANGSVDVEVAVRLLYGSVRGQKMMDYVADLIGP